MRLFTIFTIFAAYVALSSALLSNLVPSIGLPVALPKLPLNLLGGANDTADGKAASPALLSKLPLLGDLGDLANLKVALLSKDGLANVQLGGVAKQASANAQDVPAAVVDNSQVPQESDDDDDDDDDADYGSYARWRQWRNRRFIRIPANKVKATSA